MTVLAGNQVGTGGTYGRNSGQSRVSRFAVATAGTADTITANVTSSPSDVALVVYSASGVNNNATTLLGYGIVPAGQTGLVSVSLNTPIALTQGQLIWLGLSESGFLLGDDNNQISMENGVDPEDGTPESTFNRFSGQNYRAPIIYVEETGPSATIADLDSDDSVTTYQQANANGVSGFGGPITSGTLGGEAVTIIDGDWQTNSGVVLLRVPGSLATGTYDLVLSDGTDSATLSGVTFTQEYPYEAPYGQVDSNSDWTGQKLTEGTRWKVTSEFSNITYDYATGAAETPPFGNNINDHAEADAGFTGTDSQEREVIYSDGTTATYTVSVSVGDGGIDVYPYSKGIKYAATKNWTWGKRHPKTSMRTRVFK